MSCAPLVQYRIAYPGIILQPIEASLYEYILAGNGLFVRGERPELSVLLPVASFETRGLATLEPYVDLRVPRVPQSVLLSCLDQARRARDHHGFLVETVFHLWVDETSHWHMEIPEQAQESASVQPLDDSPSSSYARALLELHSHAELPPQFSSADDGDEIGFRLYAVLGHVSNFPKLKVRVGLYGYRWEIHAREIFDMPDEIRDAKEIEEATDLRWLR
jgi:PRTRC genetic system protein A